MASLTRQGEEENKPHAPQAQSREAAEAPARTRREGASFKISGTKPHLPLPITLSHESVKSKSANKL